MANKTQIIQALQTWINQRPGLEYGNYGDASSYRAEIRAIGVDLTHARAMLNYVAWHDSIAAEMILREAESGRLSIKVDSDKVSIDYCTGQYWPTEYRRAVCRLLSSVIWYWLRDNMLGDVTGEAIRRQAALALGRSIAKRWFN